MVGEPFKNEFHIYKFKGIFVDSLEPYSLKKRFLDRSTSSIS
jgi:hypothetical protein